MLRVALTGNIASGKSLVARVWERLGARIIDADELARRAVEPGSPALARIARAFGPGVLARGGGLDRAAMRDLVFRDEAVRRRLEAIVHPEVGRLRAAEEQRLGREGASIVVNDIPLLFEAGLADEFDVVVLVDAPEQVRLERLVRDRGLTREEARRMIEAQMPAESKRAGADVVIENAGTREELETRAERAWVELIRRASA